VSKGLLATEEIERSLAVTEQAILSDDRVTEDLSPSNGDTIAFSIRLLRMAHNMTGDTDMPPFGEIGENGGRDQEAPQRSRVRRGELASWATCSSPFAARW